MANTCAKCNKPGSTAVTLKRCAKCQTTMYCSRDCQKDDWKTHKKVCSSNAAAKSASTSASTTAPPPSSSSTAGPTPKGLAFQVEKPFHRLQEKKWIHNRPESDVYKLLIDSYRFRMQDNFAFEGKRTKGSIYARAADGRVGFDAFLRLANTNNLLPSWWSEEKAEECMAEGLQRGSWSSLAVRLEKAEIIDHYGQSLMPMQLRLFAEQVYGRGPGGQCGDEMIMMQMQVENQETSCMVIDTSSLFQSI